MHHAYFHESSMAEFGALKEALKPFWAREFERFGVDEARELITLASLKNFGEAVFLVGASQITTEAQQALLKLLEEPQEGTTFVLLVPHGVLLPTVRSRMLEWEPKEIPGPRSSGLLSRDSVFAESSQARPLVRKFLSAPQKERSEMIGELLDEDEGVRERARDILHALEAELSQDIKKNAAALQDIAMARDYMRDRSPSLKMLLEHIALSV